MSLRPLNYVLGLAAAWLLSSPVQAQDLPTVSGAQSVGRASIVLPPGSTWRALVTQNKDMPFSGEGIKSVPAQFKAWALVSDKRELLAIVGVRASESFNVPGGRMEWNGSCKSEDKFYVVDETKGSFGRRDCLVVRGRVGESKLLKGWLQGVRVALKQADIALPEQLLQIEHGIMNDRGQFIESLALTSVKFRGIDEQAARGQLNTIRPRTARWADLMADAARGSLGSLGGEYKLPAMIFTE